MASLLINHNFFGETGYIILVPKKSTSPLADVICTIDGIAAQTRKAYPSPHSQTSVLIEGLDPVWYVIHFYRSTDGTTLNEELLTVAGNALTGSVYATFRYEYVAGRAYDNTTPIVTGTEVWADPVASDTGIRDERLLNQVYFVNRRGVGDLLSAEIVDRSDAGGGWDFADPDTTVGDGEVFFVTVVNRTDAPPTSGSRSSDYNEVVVLAVDTDFDPTLHNAKVLIANWSANIGIFTIPNLSLLPDCKFKLTTHGGTQAFVGIQLDAGDTVEFLKDDKNVIWLGSGEEIEVLIKNNEMFITSYDGDYRRVGKRIWGDSVNMELNSVSRDGTRYAVTAQPRLVEWISVMSIAVVAEGTGSGQWGFSQVVNGITYYPNKGKYTLEGGFIRVPDDRNRFIRSLKFIDGTTDSERMSQGAGGYQRDAIKAMPNIFGVKVTGAFTIAGAIDTINATGQEFDLGHTFAIGDGTDSRGENSGMFPLLIV